LDNIIGTRCNHEFEAKLVCRDVRTSHHSATPFSWWLNTCLI